MDSPERQLSYMSDQEDLDAISFIPTKDITFVGFTIYAVCVRCPSYLHVEWMYPFDHFRKALKFNSFGTFRGRLQRYISLKFEDSTFFFKNINLLQLSNVFSSLNHYFKNVFFYIVEELIQFAKDKLLDKTMLQNWLSSRRFLFIKY